MKNFRLTYIKNRRIKLGMTQQELAKSLGYKGSSTYLKYENGTYAFKADQLPMLANELDCDISDFFI